MKLCKNCKHCKPDGCFLFWFSKCRYKYSKCTKTCKTSDVTDLTTGEIILGDYFYCSFEREDYHHRDFCGPEGKHWEAK